MPGHRFMGPGTDIKEVMLHKHLPVDDDDYVSMIHDIDYQKSQNFMDIYKADLKAMGNYRKTDLHGIAGIVGLTLKNLVVPFWGQSYFQGNEPDYNPVLPTSYA